LIIINFGSDILIKNLRGESIELQRVF